MDSMLCVEPTGTAGGLALFWKGSTHVTLEKLCDWFIDVRIFDETINKSWRLINVYFSSVGTERQSQWDFLIRYKSCLGEDWIIWGDMNDLLCEEEKLGGIPRPASSFRGFQEFVDECGLTDLGFSGHPFTWRNNRLGEGLIQERLDRVLASHSWCNLYNYAAVSHLNTVGSDHLAIKLFLNPNAPKPRVPFRFDARWADDEEAHEVIKQAWSTPFQGSRFFSVYKKVQSCRADPLIQCHETVEVIPNRVSTAMNNSLTRPVTDMEIHEALMEMGPNKAPGVDGMTALFYQSCWDIATPLLAGLAFAAAAHAAKYSIRAWQAFKARPPRMRRFYEGGFQSAMTRREATLILGVRESTPMDKIREAHRRVMVANHPDAGGSHYLASKINEAKELLLGKTKGNGSVF
ncbi:hypothetical protein Vadar_005620 [Vaccinium darrowii]|uniref:Uncharacterized protein n=1 Tax=Vaccinium darrowii TaxID=229202 RepID=A0ACB7XNF2_9ERIC|nr:hypothetical protein Vadar_005620 [Vaccinium darrowii]